MTQQQLSDVAAAVAAAQAQVQMRCTVTVQMLTGTCASRALTTWEGTLCCTMTGTA
jgi:anti-sigma-K factor RskA